MKRQLEGTIKDGIIQYMRLRGWFIFHVWQGMYSYKGISDTIAVKQGQVFFIEIKTSKKNSKQNANQIQFQLDIEQHGGKYFILRSVEDAVKFCNAFQGR